MPSKENFVFPSPLRSAFTTFVLYKTPKTMSEEYVDLFDSDDRPLSRSVPKRQAHQQGLWHRSAHVWIYDRTGNILMQKRALTKDTFPGLWDISVPGTHFRRRDPRRRCLARTQGGDRSRSPTRPTGTAHRHPHGLPLPPPGLVQPRTLLRLSAGERSRPRTLLPCSAKR